MLCAYLRPRLHRPEHVRASDDIGELVVALNRHRKHSGASSRSSPGEVMPANEQRARSPDDGARVVTR